MGIGYWGGISGKNVPPDRSLFVPPLWPHWFCGRVWQALFVTKMPRESQTLSVCTEFSTAFSPSQSIRDQLSEFLSPGPGQPLSLSLFSLFTSLSQCAVQRRLRPTVAETQAETGWLSLSTGLWKWQVEHRDWARCSLQPQAAHRLTSWLTDRQTDRLTDWLTDGQHLSRMMGSFSDGRASRLSQPCRRGWWHTRWRAATSAMKDTDRPLAVIVLYPTIYVCLRSAYRRSKNRCLQSSTIESDTFQEDISIQKWYCIIIIHYLLDWQLLISEGIVCRFCRFDKNMS